MMELSEKIIRQVTNKVFETMLFLFTETITHIPNYTGTIMQASVDYSGELSGSIILHMPAKQIPELTTWMVGEEKAYQPSLEEQHDMMGQVLNMVAGNVLSEVTNHQVNLEIQSPKIIECDYQATKTLTTGTVKHVSFKYDKGWAEVVVQILN